MVRCPECRVNFFVPKSHFLWRVGIYVHQRICDECGDALVAQSAVEVDEDLSSAFDDDVLAATEVVVAETDGVAEVNPNLIVEEDIFDNDGSIFGQ